jgi:nitrite reductase/ring-hydroxylating ferredoxin subunit
MAHTRTVICRLDELADLDSRGIAVMLEGRLQNIFVVRQGNQVFGYLNRCPHTGGPLDWVPDQFLDLEKKYIQCATHAARFRMHDGECVAGPCKGDSLAGVPVVIDAGDVVILAATPDAGPG